VSVGRSHYQVSLHRVGGVNTASVGRMSWLS